ncbi:MAG: tripartite tricarboxylate transporter TctB family protein [Synergistaceae bacterium]|nr:tripartite tricarboxylate transporter TctB family protein [Synergistaceae bacterium]MBQ3347875.1 tripartite tricarboxylate transporter TctB family protein [Synergistaceae bacterium]MBQ3758211.1 tripartite tricarboxylate transporter TctB family protein [Synergistaceae bacterium]MBQ4401827.1 tripartite tricarboxylate transporter TctB family protein [Synergistaceae bacterium]MBQ6114644.1 tripartite tricarboxylate transporter TctB family protein [Synergistaceae bacterium]
MGTKKLTELAVDAFLLLVGVVLFISAGSIDTDTALGQSSDFVPKLCTGLWIVFSVCLLVKELRTRDDGVKELGINLGVFLLTIVLLFAYIYLLNILGFTVSSMLYLIIQMLLFVPAKLRTTKNIVIFLVLAVVVPLAVNALFVNAFSLLLPEGVIFG